MPTLRPFRALRYEPAIVRDLSAVICPPYDVISPEDRSTLLARSPYNAVRIELPAEGAADSPAGHPGETDGDPYAVAADTLRAWRSAGVLRADEHPSIYAYEQRYRLPGDAERVQRGFFARLFLEPFGDGVRPHERTMAGPKEDRLRLLRATGTQTSPIVVLPEPRDDRLARALDHLTAATPAAEAVDDVGVRHRLWNLPSDDPRAARLLEAGGQGPLTIADGHHRYETALRYRDELEAGRGLDQTRVSADHVMTLVLDPGRRASPGPTILPTHRILLGPPDAGAALLARVREATRAVPADRTELVRTFAPPFEARPGRLGLITRDQALWLERRPGAEASMLAPTTPNAVRRLDVTLVETLLAELGAAVAYTHDAGEATARVASGEALAAILVAPTPLEAVLEIAAAGAVMPQKSTYFYPKVATGLVMDPLEG